MEVTELLWLDYSILCLNVMSTSERVENTEKDAPYSVLRIICCSGSLSIPITFVPVEEAKEVTICGSNNAY